MCEVSQDRSNMQAWSPSPWHSDSTLLSWEDNRTCEIVLFEHDQIHYFPDGAASQYKKYKNLSNLDYHEEDFGVTAESHFLTMENGKNDCDGVDGWVKRESTKPRSKATTTHHFLTPIDL